MTFAFLPAEIVLPGIAGARAAAGPVHPSCSLDHVSAMLADRAGQIVLSNPNLSPELLYRTRVLTTGSLYHRNVAGFMRVRAAWRSQPSIIVPDAVRATKAALVLFCPVPARSLLVADMPSDTLFDQLNQGRTPPWLHRLSDDDGSGVVLYEVMP